MTTDTFSSSAGVFMQEMSVSATASGTSEVFSLVAIRPAYPGWLSEVLERIDQLADLPANWDSYGAAMVDGGSMDYAAELIRNIAFVDTVGAPIVTASPDGNVVLCWDNGERSLDLEVLADGEVGYAYMNHSDSSKDEEGKTRRGHDILRLLTQW